MDHNPEVSYPLSLYPGSGETHPNTLSSGHEDDRFLVSETLSLSLPSSEVKSSTKMNPVGKRYLTRSLTARK